MSEKIPMWRLKHRKRNRIRCYICITEHTKLDTGVITYLKPADQLATLPWDNSSTQPAVLNSA